MVWWPAGAGGGKGGPWPRQWGGSVPALVSATEQPEGSRSGPALARILGEGGAEAGPARALGTSDPKPQGCFLNSSS